MLIIGANLYKQKLYNILENPQKSKLGYFINIFIHLLIVVSILNLMFSSVNELQNEYGSVFTCITNTIMPIFILEYILRLYACGANPKYQGFLGKIKYAKTLYMIIDLLSILPYIFANFGINTSFIRSLRLLRIFRLFRIKKYTAFILQMKQIFSTKKEEFLTLFFFTIVIIVLLSFAVYAAENKAQPEVFSNLFQALWWAVATLTTVGYGDMYPITTIGKSITALISILGIAFIAIPGGIFASEFINSVSHENELKCPHCDNLDIKQSEQNIDINNVTYKKSYTCKKCKFTWLE